MSQFAASQTVKSAVVEVVRVLVMERSRFSRHRRRDDDGKPEAGSQERMVSEFEKVSEFKLRFAILLRGDQIH